ncbi:uncharacterized protein LOC114365462 [Ostrinia furnacalis]|uniref:uncharacterized protein LOC114365462 n=1 Tax=Ostrinia furnacalis TaxID=93504 RepID=UPI00103CA380|nr:uncharacterized protein LOC114365462 [Ostrinia furnacalis]
MLTKEILYFVVCFVINLSASDDTVIVSLRPEDVVNTFKNVLSSRYMKELANEFAAKAAHYFIKEMRNKEKEFTKVDPKSNDDNFGSRIPSRAEYPRNNYPELAILDEEEAMALLQDPSPDGDNLEKESPYLSNEEISGKDSKRDIPVIGVMKINGVYFRRLLGVL